MLQESDIEERARYCYCVFLQLSWLHGNDFAHPANYMDFLANSSLGLGSDEFVKMTVGNAAGLHEQPDGGLLSLISLYEGFTHAFCQVLEKDLEEIRAQIPAGFLRKLAEEMGAEDRI